MHISPSTLSRWESGQRGHAYADALVALAEELDISLDWLLRGLGEMPLPPGLVKESHRPRRNNGDGGHKEGASK